MLPKRKLLFRVAKNKFTIIFENENFVAVNKPAGMLSISSDRAQSEKSLKEFLIDKYGQIFTVHRLDKDTSGLILLAKTEASHKFFSIAF
jgi:23S rRNA pseudouridine955/2504/2580 synthase/23S rRNA pseudouridine1911/1915/1917 synthase